MEQRHRFGQRKFSALQRIQTGIDVIVFGAGKISPGEVGVDEQTAGKVGVRKIRLRKINFPEINLVSHTFNHFDFRQAQANKGGMIEHTF